MDMYSNIYVKKANDRLLDYLKENGFKPKQSVWDRNYKGIDDFLKYIANRK